MANFDNSLLSLKCLHLQPLQLRELMTLVTAILAVSPRSLSVTEFAAASTSSCRPKTGDANSPISALWGRRVV